MRAIVIAIFLLCVGIAVGYVYFTPPQNSGSDRVSPTESKRAPSIPQDLPSDEEAELVGFGFVQDFIASAPPDPDSASETNAYNALSESAKKSVSEESVSRDLAGFIGVQDVPDLGASVEDLQKPTDESAVLIVGLNYTGGRVLKAIHMIIEDGMWKVDRVEQLDSYPPEN